MARNSATPPPGTMPSSTAARVACIASSTRSLRSFTSISEAAADPDHRNAAGQLGQPLLQLLPVVVGGRLLDLGPDLAAAALDVLLLAGAVDDRRLFLGEEDTLGSAEHVGGHVLQLDAEIFRDHLAAGQDGDVFEHGLAAIAEARRLDRRDLEAAAQLVDDERRQGPRPRRPRR